MNHAVQLRSIQTLVPDVTLEQHTIRDMFAAQPGLSRLAQRLIATSFDGAGVETRHTVLPELDPAAEIDAPQFLERTTGELLEPGT
ncbi:MAG: type III polyketide synthase, partial [Actinomycetota bacterium]|nr:type III polyketide synthase [Actinomycetota bacterium]